MTEELKVGDGGVMPPREALLVKAMKKYQQAKIPSLALKNSSKKNEVTVTLDEQTPS